MPKGSCDLIKLSWEETEAEAHCALKSGKRYYRLVTMETATSANNCHQLDQSADHLLVTKMGAVLGLKGERQERDSRPVTGENMWVLGGSPVDQQRLYWDTGRGEHDKLGLPRPVAVILAVLKTAQSTREGRSWEAPPNTQKLLSPHLSSHSGKFQLPPETGSSSCPFLHRVRTIHFPCPHAHPHNLPRLSHLEFQPDHFLFQECDFLSWTKALPVPAALLPLSRPFLSRPGHFLSGASHFPPDAHRASDQVHQVPTGSHLAISHWTQRDTSSHGSGCHPTTPHGRSEYTGGQGKRPCARSQNLPPKAPVLGGPRGAVDI